MGFPKQPVSFILFIHSLLSPLASHQTEISISHIIQFSHFSDIPS